MRALVLCVVLATTLAAQTQFQPTTTLSAELGNNTAAPDTISMYTNGIAAAGNVSKQPIRELLYAGANTKVFAALMGWFGKASHISVGYDSRQAAQVRKQVQDMRSRGIDGAILAWYGKNSYENATAQELKRQAEADPGFEFILMIDQGALQWDSMGMTATDALITHLNYLADNYYASPAYTKVNGRPVVIEFALEMHPIDWVRVRSSIRGNPVIIFRNPNGWTRPLSDGAYSWEPEKTDLGYLDYFYSQSNYFPTLQTMGSLSPSFNDSLASWGAKRYADGRCGQTWLAKAAQVAKFYSTSKQLHLLQIATWNDYEEGSTIESGIDNCLGVTAEVHGSELSWSLTGIGNENTVHHYTVFASQDGVGLMPVAELPPGSRTLDLSKIGLPSGTYSIFVKAVGKASILNKMSNSAPFTTGLGSSPAAAADFSLSTTATALTVTPAQPATVSLQVTSRNGFADTLSFSCTGLPAGVQCAFAPATLQATPNAANVTTLMVRTTQAASLGSAGSALGAASGLLLVSLLAGTYLGRRRRIGAALLLAGCTVVMAACGGGTAPKTSSVSAQPTSAAITVVATPASPGLPARTMQLTLTLR